VELKFLLVFVLSIRMHLSNCRQRPDLNNISLPPGVKFAPRGELGPQGWTLSSRGYFSCKFERNFLLILREIRRD
jgi:hypothetical protein